MTDTDRIPQLTRRGMMRRLGHSADGLAVALVLPPPPVAAGVAAPERPRALLEPPRARPAGVPAHAVEIRPREPFTADEWAYLVERGDLLRDGRGLVFRGGSAFTWTDSGHDLGLADCLAAAIALGLGQFGRPLPFEYTLHGGGHTVRRAFGRDASAWSEPLPAA